MADRRILIVAFDGLRPDMATPELTPNLCQFMAEGTKFRNGRTVYPSSTRTNAVALATRATPCRNGIVQNKYFDPNIFRDRMFRPDADTVVRAVERSGLVQHLKYTRVGSTTYLDAGWVE